MTYEITETVGLENYRHITGSCFTTWTKPGTKEVKHCGDPRCSQVHSK